VSCEFDKLRLADHFQDHGADFGASSEAEYDQKASDFMCGPKALSTWECRRPAKLDGTPGDIIRIDPVSWAIGCVSSTNIVRTYFILKPVNRTTVYFKWTCSQRF
jgi:hypothetical protein